MLSEENFNIWKYETGVGNYIPEQHCSEIFREICHLVWRRSVLCWVQERMMFSKKKKKKKKKIHKFPCSDADRNETRDQFFAHFLKRKTRCGGVSPLAS